MMLLMNGSPDEPAPTYRQIREHALAAEAAGLDSIWVYDHLLFRFPEQPDTGGMREVWTVWSALAEATSRIHIGSMVLCTAFRNPAILAKMAAELDHVSEGRITLGIGCGWHQPEFDAFGIPFDHRVDRFEEAVKIIGPLLRTGEVDFTGAYYSAPHCELMPRPDRPDIPILIASRGERMLRLTAEHADSWNTAWHGDSSGYIERVAGLRAACEQVGRDISEIELTAGVRMGLGQPDPNQTEEDKRRHFTGDESAWTEALRGYRDAGCDHVIAALDELTIETIETLARARAAAINGA